MNLPQGLSPDSMQKPTRKKHIEPEIGPKKTSKKSFESILTSQ